MSQNTATYTPPVSGVRLSGISRWAVGLIAGLLTIVAACLWTLETRFDGLTVDHITVEETPVTLYRLTDAAPRPPVVVAHGFGGSRQMMDQISVSLARQGFVVASLDFPGQGRHPGAMSADISRIEGTTAQLARTVLDVAEALVNRTDTLGPVSFVGHSMATDVVIRAASERDDVAGVVAISMYSPAVTAAHPAQLLVLSGAAEGHLRQAALDVLHQLDPQAQEGDTVASEGSIRRAAVAPYVGHVGVLYAPTSLEELTTWIRMATGSGEPARLDLTGWVPGVLLAAITLLALPLSNLMPRNEGSVPQRVSRPVFWACVIVPVPVTLVPALLPIFGVAGFAAFGTLAVCFALWGGTQLALLWRAGIRPTRPDLMGTVAYLLWGLAVFAVALDQYGAAFVPTGGRVLVMLGLVFGTLPLMLADTLLVDRAPWWRRLVARFALLLALGTAMGLAPLQLGLAFTTLPVLLLFFLVYGTLGRWIAARRGAGGAALGKAVALAWASAASTPLFATGL